MERGKLSGMGKYGMGHMYQRGHIWWIAYSKAGLGQQRESSKSRRREDAVRLLKARLGEIVTGNFRTTRTDDDVRTVPAGGCILKVLLCGKRFQLPDFHFSVLFPCSGFQ